MMKSQGPVAPRMEKDHWTLQPGRGMLSSGTPRKPTLWSNLAVRDGEVVDARCAG